MKKVMYNNSELSGSFGTENLPVGAVVQFAGQYAPLGFLMCNGQTVSRTEYAALFAVIGTIYGAGDGSTTFNLPDFRECVPVGVGQNGIHTIATHDVYGLGEFKDDQVQTHSHTINHQHGTGSTANTGILAYSDSATLGLNTGISVRFTMSSRDVNIPAYSGSSGNNSGRSGTTTRGKSIGINYIIKYAKAVIPAQPTEEPIIDDNNVSYTSTFSSAKITQKLTEWVDITNQVTLTQMSSSGAWSYTLKKFYMCGNQVKCTIGVVFNHNGSGGSNPLKLKISSPLFTTTAELSNVYYSSFYGASVWTQGLNVYDGENDIITFRPTSNYSSGTDAHFDGIIAVIPR